MSDDADDLLGFAGGPITVTEPAPATAELPAGERLGLGEPLRPHTPTDQAEAERWLDEKRGGLGKPLRPHTAPPDEAELELKRLAESFRQTDAITTAHAVPHKGYYSDAVIDTLINRLDAIDRQLLDIGDPVALTRSLMQISEAVGHLQQQVHAITQQRAAFDVQMERHTRATALDLAIKAAPGGDIAAITTMAGGFLTWLKAVPTAPQHQNGAGSE